MDPLAGIADKIQGHNKDIIEPNESVSCCIENLKYVTENIEKKFDQIFIQAKQMAINLGVQPTLLCRVARQMHRNNVTAENPRKYYERSLEISLLENFISELEFCFNDLGEKSSKFLFFVSAVITKMENPYFQ